MAGIAVIAVDNTPTAAGSTRPPAVRPRSLPAVSATGAARLLAATSGNIGALRALWPTGTAAWRPGLQFRAIRPGVAGNTGDTSITGGTSAFSTATATSGIVVHSVNDAPSGTDRTVTNVKTPPTFFDRGFPALLTARFRQRLAAVRIAGLLGAGSASPTTASP